MTGAQASLSGAIRDRRRRHRAQHSVAIKLLTKKCRYEKLNKDLDSVLSKYQATPTTSSSTPEAERNRLRRIGAGTLGGQKIKVFLR